MDRSSAWLSPLCSLKLLLSTVFMTVMGTVSKVGAIFTTVLSPAPRGMFLLAPGIFTAAGKQTTWWMDVTSHLRAHRYEWIPSGIQYLFWDFHVLCPRRFILDCKESWFYQTRYQKIILLFNTSATFLHYLFAVNDSKISFPPVIRELWKVLLFVFHPLACEEVFFSCNT